MKLSNDKPDRKTFEPHPEGTHAAICVDVFSKEQPNMFKGQVSKFTGEVDTRDTVTNVCLAFMTSETIEIDGVVKPRYASFWAPMTWHEKSKLRGFVSKWMPAIGKENNVDLDELIGKVALISVKHKVKKNGNVGAECDAAMALPKAMQSLVPVVPDDFVRHKDKEAKDEAPKATPKAPAPIEDDGEAPF